MNDDGNESPDLLGLKPISDSVKIVVETSAIEASRFLNAICYPAAEEFGYLLRDKVRWWRINNISNTTIKAKNNFNINYDEFDLTASPRIVNSILKNSSWIDNDKIQDMWAGLLVSSCSKSGKDESNLIFINLLSQLTSSEVRILNYICINSEKNMTIHSIMYANELSISLKKLQEISGLFGIHNLDREIDHLRSLGLLWGGFPPISKDTINAFKRPSDINSKNSEDFEADISPSALALNMYVRCNGSLQAPIEYFGLKE